MRVGAFHGSFSVVQSFVIVIRFALVLAPVSVFSEIRFPSTSKSCPGELRLLAWIFV